MKWLARLYLIAVSIALGGTLLLQSDYESKALRLDLKVMTLEIKDQSAIIDRMGKFRNQTRAIAQKLQLAVFLLLIAVILGAEGRRVEGSDDWFLIAVSVMATGAASYFAAVALAQ